MILHIQVVWLWLIIAGRPVHVVAACNELDQEVIVITVYEPDPKIWSDGFTRRIL